MAQAVLATGNAKKLDELRRILIEADASDIEVLGLADVADYPAPAETERSFAGNALLKARVCVAKTGLPALADDSGLAVDVLNQMPGVRSARWAGPECDDEANNTLLLRQLDDVPDHRRTAQFICALALVLPDGSEFVEEGEMHGLLLREPRGANGFGYDPLFQAFGQTGSNAELTAAEKDAISHRGQALRAMLPTLLRQLRAGANENVRSE